MLPAGDADELPATVLVCLGSAARARAVRRRGEVFGPFPRMPTTSTIEV
jgi:hypothetical protein